MQFNLWILLLSVLLVYTACTRSGNKNDVVTNLKEAATKEQIMLTTGDTAKINSSLDLAEKITSQFPDSAAALLLNALSSSKLIGYELGRGKAYFCLYFVMKQMGQHDEAARYYQEGVHYMEHFIAHASRPQDNYIIRPFYCYLTLLHARTNDWKRTTELRSLAEPSFDLKDSIQLLQWLQINTEVGTAHINLAQYDSALASFHTVLQKFPTADAANYFILSNAYQGIGYVNARMEGSFLDQSIQWFQKSAVLAKQFSDTSIVLTMMGNIATYWYDKGEFDSAKAYGEKILTLINHNTAPQKYVGHKIQLLQTVATSLINQDSAAKALSYSTEAFSLAQSISSIEQEISAQYVLGYNYAQLGRYAAAEKTLLDAIDKAKRTQQQENLTNGYGQLSEVYAHLGQYKLAFKYRKLYSSLRDTLLGKENATRIATINAQYQLAQKDVQLAEKDKEILQKQLRIASQQNNQYLWIGASLLTIIVLLALHFRRKQKIAISELRASLAGQELERSRLARELHDGIVSRLSLIKMNFSAIEFDEANQTHQNNFDDIVNQLEQSISELRSTSHNLLPEFIKRAGLVNSLNAYFAQIKKTTSLEIHFQLIGELPTLTHEFQLNIYRIIQELINNIIKHTDATDALIQFQVVHNQLNITIDNNGSIAVPSDQNKEKSLQGIGFSNLQERIKLLNGTFELETGGNYSVFMEFNLKKFIVKQ